uniref:Putative ribonuclease H-like domain-containing protein n=1 Tax=Tanacetum cinerariifolium TaxID=118510 RepID=A0A6L2KWM4_TANCI|nr:putative ribonuclease H-like domain-containing protein [Tanacetum cinerariifolium]
MKVEENLHIKFLENKSNVAGKGPEWIFDIDLLIISMNYEPVTDGNQTNNNAGKEIHNNARQAGQEKASDHEYILLPFMSSNLPLSSSTQSSDYKDVDEVPGKGDEGVSKGSRFDDQERIDSSTQDVNIAGPSINTANTNINIFSRNINIVGSNDPSMPSLEETGIFNDVYDDREVGTEADTNNLELLTVMDVKSAFLYGTIEEEVYVCQPPGFEDPYFSNKVYKVEKALYGLHQAFKAWYETLSTYLLENGFRRGTIDKTLFIKKDRGDILLVQVYVGDIIFGSKNMSLCGEFEQMMHNRFQMSSVGELTFFLGLQVKQKEDRIFISQDKYVADILKKFDFTIVNTVGTLMEPNKPLIKDAEAKDVDVHLYRLMIRSLMYLIDYRPDIMFVVYACARFQVTPNTSHLRTVKRIFKYLKGQPKLGLWYPRDLPFDLEAFSDSDYAGASLDKKSTTGGCQFLGKRLISWQCKKQTIVSNSTTKAEYVAAANCYGQVDSGKVKTVNEDVQIRALIDGKKINVTEASIRCYLQLQDAEGTAYLPNDTIFEKLARIGTVASTIICLAKNQRFNFSMYILDNMVKNLEARVKFFMFPRFVQKKQKSRRKQRQETKVPYIEPQTKESVPIPSKVMELSELMELCTKLSYRVLSLEQIMINQAAEIKKLKKRVKRLEGKKKKKRTHGLKRMYKVGLSARIVSSDEEGLGDQEDASKQGRIAKIDVDEDLSLINETTQDQERMNKETFLDYMILMTLIEIKAAKPKARGVIVQEPSEFKITSSLQPSQLPQVKDKGKGIMVEPMKPLKKKDQIALHESRQLEAQMKAEIEVEERIEKEKDKANIAVTKE